MKELAYLIMDVDGTMTDGSIYIGDHGEFLKKFCIKDGLGIKKISSRGVTPVVITGRESKIVSVRASELGITHVYQNIDNKDVFLSDSNIDLSRSAYIGDDENDLQAMLIVKKAGGLVGCPHDSSESVKNISDYICVNDGGKGAVREFIEWLLNLENNK